MLSSSAPQGSKLQDDVVLRHLSNNLIKSVVDFFESFPVSRISNVINDMAFYCANPDCCKDLDGEDTTRMLVDALSLVNELCEVFDNYRYYLLERDYERRVA